MVRSHYAAERAGAQCGGEVGMGWLGQRRGVVPFRDFVKGALPELIRRSWRGPRRCGKNVHKLLKMKERGEMALSMEWAEDVHKTRRGSRSNDPPVA